MESINVAISSIGDILNFNLFGVVPVYSIVILVLAMTIVLTIFRILSRG